MVISNVYSQVLKQKFLNSLKDRHDSLPLLVNITCKRSLFLRRLRSELRPLNQKSGS